MEPTAEMIERGLVSQERVARAQERMADSQEKRTQMLREFFDMLKPVIKIYIKELFLDEKDRRNKKSS